MTGDTDAEPDEEERKEDQGQYGGTEDAEPETETELDGDASEE